MTTIILLNGPPRSGKDMAATLIRKDLGAEKCTEMKFATSLKKTFGEMFSLTDMQLHNMVETPQKDIEQEMLNGFTPRRVLIEISELFCKPRFGNEFFGTTLARRIEASSSAFVVVSDCGFGEEIAPLIRRFGKQNIFGISLERDGCSFEGDSRNYIDWSGCSIQSARIKNNYELDLYRVQLRKALSWIPKMQQLLEQE